MQVSDDIAVVGIAYKLPQDLEDDDAFWRTLQEAKNLSTEWPKDRMNPDAHPDPKNGQSSADKNRHETHSPGIAAKYIQHANSQAEQDSSRGGHFITQDAAGFDAPFFSLTAKEAASMDPMQRWTLEVSYRAFESAGIPSETLKGSRTAVLSASWTQDYIRMAALDPDNYDRTTATGAMASIIPNRVSYFFGMQGPSFHIDTACSSGLSAFDVACKLIKSGDADAALVTASNLLLEPGVYQMLRNMAMLSPDSTCKSFDHRANGFARGEGVLGLVLKPLRRAVESGDMIRAVVRSVASNQDGHTPVLSQPNSAAQEKLIRFTYAQAGLGLDKTRYVEAHGTGTPVGDPIEMKAIGNAFRHERSLEQPLYVASTANIGHLEGASGLAGLVKAILILERGVIPPNALFEKLNPAIDADHLRVQVPSKPVPWPSAGIRRVSLNSFGFGGSNTHVVLDDALHYLEERGLAGHHCTVAASPAAAAVVANGSAKTNGSHEQTNGHVNGMVTPAAASSSSNSTTDLAAPRADASVHPKLLVFSAFDEKAAKRTLEGYGAWYHDHKIPLDRDRLDALAYTLAARRTHMRWRSFAIAGAATASEDHSSISINGREADDAQATALEALDPARPVRVAAEPSLCWVFTGQGAQYLDMGWELIGMYPVFEESLKRVEDVYRSLGCDWSIFDQLRNGENIHKPEYSQPLSTAIQIALIELLRSFGVAPKAVVGHSSGEIAAAYAIGALSLASASKVSYFRGQVAGKLRAADASSAPGAMISINLKPEQVVDFLGKIQPQAAGVDVACFNSPLNVTLSGPEAGIDAVKAQADREGIFAPKLNTGVAYHSSSMHSVVAEYLELMGDLEAAEPLPIPMVSTVTGKMTTAPTELATGQYWVDNMISPVRFASAVKLVASEATGWGITDWVEVGSHPALKRYVQDTVGKDRPHYSSLLQRNHSPVQKTLEFAGTMFSRGHDISLTAVNRQQHDGRQKGARRFVVDCPPYPFDHANKPWAESRMSVDYRLREPTKGDALAHKMPDWNPLQPRWRSFLSVETHPWIGHHVVGDTVLYPAAGMLVMAIEAAREMAPAGKAIAGYYVREARFMKPVVVPENWDDRIETIISLQPAKKAARDRGAPSDWSDVSIFTYERENRSWNEVFTASIQVQYSHAAGDAEKQMADEATREQHRQARQLCNLPIDSQILYGDARDHGLQYGEWFQLCQDIYWDKSGGRAIASVPVAGSSSSNSTRYSTASLVHPAVLDTVFHALRVSAGQQPATNVPSRLADAWFAASGWQAPSTSTIRWLACSSEGGQGSSRKIPGEQGSVSATADDGTVLATIGKLVTAAISTTTTTTTGAGGAQAAEGDAAGPRDLLYATELRPQLSLLSPSQLSRACNAARVPGDGAATLADHRKRTRVLNIAAARDVKSVPPEKRARLDSTLRNHLDWMDGHVRSLAPADRAAAESMSEAEYQAELDAFGAAWPAWALYPHVARGLPGIMSGELDPLQVIFASEYAKTFYAALFEPVCGDGRLRSFLQLAAHERPSMRILEVGAGTGGVTVHVLNALREREQRTGAVSFAEYMYTDITPAFFEAAKAQWDAEGLGGRMAFRALDMEHPVAGQGFVENSYDMLVAGCCIHATERLDNTMQNVRRLLKPGGKLVLLEITNPADIVSCFFATLASGWWLSKEDWRIQQKSPLATESKWDEILKQNGFSGNDLLLKDAEGEAHIVSVIVSTAVEEEDKEASQEKAVPLPRRVYVVDARQESQKTLASQLAGAQDIIVALEQMTPSTIESDDIVVSLTEVDRTLLDTISEAHFAQLQSLFRQARNLVWVTAPRDGVDDAHLPHYSVAQGFLRTVRAEMPEIHIVSLAIEDRSSTEERARLVDTVVRAAFAAGTSPELEYVVRDGQMHTARATRNARANDKLHALLAPRLQQLAWKDGPPAVRLAVGRPGSLDSLRFEQDERSEAALGPHDVEVEARAWGLGRRDALAALGRLQGDGHDAGDMFGSDCAGVVTRVGSECDAQGPQPGDRVVMSARGCASKLPRAHEARTVRMPAGMTFETAAAALGPAATAYHALVDVARVEAGDRVLVHEAASATGQMMVRMAQRQGAGEVYVTTSAAAATAAEEQTERQFLVSRLGVVADRVFSAGGHSTAFAAGVRRLTRGCGVDVVVNTLAGDQLQAGWDLLRAGGRFVDLGLDERGGGSSTMPRADRNKSFAAVDVLDLRPRTAAKLLRNTVALLESGDLPPPAPVRTFPVPEVGRAFAALQHGEGPGRVVVVPQPDDVVDQLVFDRRAQQPVAFRADASYLVPGGLGGLGKSILAWMADHGARHLIVPSRSGASAPASAALVSSLASRGVEVSAPACDISSEAELAALLEENAKTMPHIRGVINCAMVLPNAVFTSMTFEQWSVAVHTKVAVSFNLHRLLQGPEEGLDFIVHLASLAGVNGQMASSNYAAGCTFQDALTRCYPRTVSLDIGWMADVGLIAETAAYQRQLMEWDNMQRLEARELLGVLDVVCGAEQADNGGHEALGGRQLLIGLRTPADFLAKNKGKPLPPVLDRPFLSTFARSVSPAGEGGEGGVGGQSGPGAGEAAAAVDYGALFRSTPDGKARAAVVVAAMAEKLARATMMPADDVDPGRTLSAYGIDSLMAIDLRNWVAREFGAKLSIWELTSGEKPIKTIAETVVGKSTAVKV
ncbi:hypothetical protein GGR56DRAFT_683480 [Xylariaceae sp. FL0804]|nr:hypothetical protein GGR56DRAFT_683480 [Xylariaceae sp. FL0804]